MSYLTKELLDKQDSFAKTYCLTALHNVWGRQQAFCIIYYEMSLGTVVANPKKKSQNMYVYLSVFTLREISANAYHFLRNRIFQFLHQIYIWLLNNFDVRFIYKQSIVIYYYPKKNFLMHGLFEQTQKYSDFRRQKENKTQYHGHTYKQIGISYQDLDA